MKRLYLLFLVFFTLGMSAQVQKGFVKTIGRKNAPGKPLGNVVISVTGNNNQSISDAKGHFDFKLKDKTYSFSNIHLQGYNLVDKDVIGRLLQYSNLTPVQIVMVSRREQADMQSRIEEDLYAKLKLKYETLQQQAKKHYLDNQNLKDAVQRLQHVQDSLNRRYKQEENLISDLAARLSLFDYDNSDSLQFSINNLIEQGDFDGAQHIIESKGTMEERLAKFKRDEKSAQKILDLNTAAQYRLTKERNELAQDLWNKYLIGRSKGDKMQTILTYLVQRANLDSTNIRWQLDVGDQIFFYYYDVSMESITYNSEMQRYYDRAYMLIRESKTESIYLNEYFDKLFRLYKLKDNYAEAKTLYEEGLKACKESGLDNLNLKLDYASTIRDDQKALDFLLPILKENKSQRLFVSIANRYSKIKKYKESNKYYTMAMEIVKTDSTASGPLRYNNSIAENYRALHKTKDAINYMEKHFDYLSSTKDNEIYEAFYRSNIADSIAKWNSELGMTANAIKWLKSSIDIIRQIPANLRPQRYTESMAYNLMTLAVLECKQNVRDHFEGYFLEALQAMESPYIDSNELGTLFYCYYAKCYAIIGEFDRCQKMLDMVRQSKNPKVQSMIREVESIK